MCGLTTLHIISSMMGEISEESEKMLKIWNNPSAKDK